MQGKTPVGESQAQARVSVIIPALNEAGTIVATLASLRPARAVEVIVADGGSRDETAELARAQGAQVVTVPGGRAAQMNRGATTATGDILVFLHADTRLPAGFDDFVRRALSQPGAVAGAFELGVDAPGRGLRLIEWLANFRSRRLQMPYGDQALFLRAERFREAGGFPEIPFMEDFEFVRRLRRRGRIVMVPARVLTSGRRWLELGILKTTLMNQAAIAAYFLGVSPARIGDWYYSRRAAQEIPCPSDEEKRVVGNLRI